MAAPTFRGGLTFDALRDANLARLPHFKNGRGEPAHAVPDGSDWSPAQWLQAVVGELGEYANLRKKYERGDVDAGTFAAAAADELGDVACYLDLLAARIGIDLGVATVSKWNRVSERIGYDGRLGIDASAPVPTGDVASAPLAVECGASNGPFRCNRPAGHDGAHLDCAGGRGSVGWLAEPRDAPGRGATDQAKLPPELRLSLLDVMEAAADYGASQSRPETYDEVRVARRAHLNAVGDALAAARAESAAPLADVVAQIETLGRVDREQRARIRLLEQLTNALLATDASAEAANNG